MSSNPYLQWFTNENEQNLFADLFTEQIENHAHDVYYLPRSPVNEDQVLNEYEIVKFNNAIFVDVYLKNTDSFEGDGQLLSKFGLEIRDQMTVVLSKRTFQRDIQPISNKARPYEGDCIYLPMTGNMYQIKYVNTSAVFYALGDLYSYEIVCELLEYNNEQFSTGVNEIDSKYPAFQHASSNTYSLESYDNNAANEVIQDSADQVIDFTELDPFEVGEH